MSGANPYGSESDSQIFNGGEDRGWLMTWGEVSMKAPLEP